MAPCGLPYRGRSGRARRFRGVEGVPSWAAAAAVAVTKAVLSAKGAAGQSQPAATAALVSEEKALPFRMKVDRGGGASCTHDVECGWYDPSIVGEDRMSLPSGNGARCLVGHCVCPNSYDDQYGCSRCSVRLRTRYSYGDEAMVVTSRIRNRYGEHIDLCEYPSGGRRCEVGVCKRDSYNQTIWCPGDTECDVAGVGAGACIGPERGVGHCLCAEGMYCSDCSLHETAFVEGAKCDRYATGGAHCRSQGDCSEHAYCAHIGFTENSKAGSAANSELRSFCKCDDGYGCRRCRHHVRELESGRETCGCDPPSFHPNGGEFNVRELHVNLTSVPWDSYAECEVLFFVERVVAMPLVPLFGKDAPKAEVVRHLSQLGTKQSIADDGSMVRDPRPSLVRQLA